MTFNGSDLSKSVQNVDLRLGHSNLVFEDDSESSTGSVSEVLSQDITTAGSSVSDGQICPTAINVENSTDVIIGPVTQFHGPVTIYHNVKENGILPAEKAQNGKIGKSESTSSEHSHHGLEKRPKICPLETRFVKYAIAVILGIIIVIIIIAITVSKTASSSESTKLNSDEIDTSIDTPIGAGFFVSRHQWGALPPTQVIPLSHPTPLVVIAHTASGTCSKPVSCSEKVRNIQQYHLSVGGGEQFADIAYNFLIGGDANVYIGRGWDAKNSERNNSIVISFIGNFVKEHLSDEMIKTTQALLAKGVEDKKLASNYTLVCHSQVAQTLSPGRHVCNIIKKWPHYSSRLYFE